MNSLKLLLIKEFLFDHTRSYFKERDFHEIDTPVLNRSLPLEPNIYSFEVSWPYLSHNLYLTTSPEASLKHYLALGLGNCFSLAKCFRNLESPGPTHNPEFTMLEWYEIGKDYIKLMSSVQDYLIHIFRSIDNSKFNRTSNILNYQGLSIDLKTPWTQFTMDSLFHDFAHLDLSQNLTLEKLKITAIAKGYTVSHTDNWESLFNQIFLNEIEPSLPKDRPFFITNYPSSISPLCHSCHDNPGFSERFELYLGGMELANGCTENTSPELITKSFSSEKQDRIKHHLPLHKENNQFITDSGKLPLSAGVGVGMDRLLLILSDLTNINLINNI